MRVYLSAKQYTVPCMNLSGITWSRGKRNVLFYWWHELLNLFISPQERLFH